MANVRYWKVKLSHVINGNEIVDVIGVVADSAEEAKLTCELADLQGVTILDVQDGGHVRFIRHKWRGPETKVSVDGEPVDGVQPK